MPVPKKLIVEIYIINKFISLYKQLQTKSLPTNVFVKFFLLVRCFYNMEMNVYFLKHTPFLVLFILKMLHEHKKMFYESC